MQMIFIEYPKCSTCIKAKKWLKENGVEFTERNIVTQTPTQQELKEWIAISKKDIKKWFNTSGLKYKELNLKEKLPTLDSFTNSFKNIGFSRPNIYSKFFCKSVTNSNTAIVCSFV